MAWQFDRPDTGEGSLQVFRRTNSPASSMQFPLHGLDPTRIYDVEDFDHGDLGWHTGSELMGTGLTVQLGPQQAAVFYYTLAVLQITMLSNAEFVLNWPGAVGQFYTIEGSTHPPSGGSWLPVATNIAGTGAANAWTGQVSQVAEFFRVKHQ
jgi:hypothetical protein